MGETFYNQRDTKNIEKIREICSEMPDFVTEFVVSIQLRTTTLTRLGYVSDLRIFFNYLIENKFKYLKNVSEVGIDELSKLKAYDVELFLEYLGSYVVDGKRYRCGVEAKERKLSSLRTFFKFMYRHDKLSENVTDKVGTPKIKDKPIRFLEVNEIAELLDVAESGKSLSPRQKAYQSKTKKRDVAMLSLFLGTGIRISECVGIDKKDVDLEINAVAVTRKGGAKTVLYFSDEVAAALREYLQWLEDEKAAGTEFARRISDDEALFLSLKGTRITPRAVQLLVEKYANVVAPLKHITPHKLRSTFGTALYRETKDIYVVADVLGHRDVNTTKKHYAAISDEIRRAAASSVKLRED